MIKNLHKGVGHRKRLRDRFLQSGLGGFLDYEIIELLLTLGTPQKDCKPMAKAAIKQFKGLRGVLDASLEDLQAIKGIGPSNAFGIKLFQAVSERYSKEKIPAKTSLTTPREVSDYLMKRLGKEKKEHFVVILLDTKNNLIDIRDISVGILNASLVHPREVFEPAIRHVANGIIVVHNHPSGDVHPSSEDDELTKQLVASGKILGIQVLDHIIVSGNDYYSFASKKAHYF